MDRDEAERHLGGGVRRPDRRATVTPSPFKRKQSARDGPKQAEADALRGTFVPRTASRVTVTEVFEGWLGGALDLAPATRAKYEERPGRKHVLPHLGRMNLGDLTAPIVRGWIGDVIDRGVG